MFPVPEVSAVDGLNWSYKFRVLGIPDFVFQ